MTSDALHSSDEISKQLFKYAIKRQWRPVIEIYKNNQEAREVKITKSGDTALHMAISDGNESVVKKLASVANPKTALRMKNNLGNTPLHLAAYQGNPGMCYAIASRDAELMGERNHVNETPFFLAVVHGKKDAFLCMHRLCKENQGYVYGRRNDGRTILHAAISGEHFDLAFQIIHLYEKFQNWNSEKGTSPLHILARKPSAFKSGSQMKRLDKLIYDRVHVQKLKPIGISSQGHQHEDNAGNSSPTSFSLIHWLRNVTRAPDGHGVHKTDAENPNDDQIAHEKAIAPKIYTTRFHGLKLIFEAIGEFLGLGPTRIKKIREEKKKHTWSMQIMEKLLAELNPYEYEYCGNSLVFASKDNYKEIAQYKLQSGNMKFNTDHWELVDDDCDQPLQPGNSLEAQQSNKAEQKQGTNDENNKAKKIGKKESALLTAAKNGIIEMVEGILETLPMAIHDENQDGKNIVLLAVENRQPHVYQFLRGLKVSNETIFYKTDKWGNSALHLAAVLQDTSNWNTSGPALQMQWEIKWYEFVENSRTPKFFVKDNGEGETAWEVFRRTHKELVKEASKWLNETSQSCATVATLIATVAFTASATIPGGLRSDSGTPLLENEPAFNIFAISSLVALCFSISSVLMFLVFFTSRYHQKDFGRNLPTKLLVELTSLLISIAAVLVSFCAAHFFVIKDSLKYVALPLYAVTLLPVALYAVWQFPTYLDLAAATFDKTPQRMYDHD